MGLFEWTDQLDIGVDAMNRDHQRLIAIMNCLYQEVEEQADRTTLGATLGQLGAFTVEHFAREEKYMQSIGFPTLETHKRIHERLLLDFKTHAGEFEATGVVSERFFQFLKLWLSAHIKGIDRKYGEFSASHATAS